MATIGVEKLARALNLTRARIAQLVHEGMPKEARGQYDFFKCAAWYIRFLQRAIERQTVPTLEEGSAGERVARLRILRTQADLKEIELSKQRSQLVANRDVEAAVSDLVRTTTATIMALPPRLASELVGETSRVMIQAKIDKAVKKALHDVARTPLTSVLN